MWILKSRKKLNSDHSNNEMLKRLLKSKAARNATASYFAFFSIAAVAFLSIPIAVHYLEPEQIGLWAVVNQIIGYLLWMDLGVGKAAGRKLAGAIHNHDTVETNRWWTATQFALILQGLLIAVLAIILIPIGLHLFRIPESLNKEAWILLTGSALVTAISLPLKAVPGLMSAQERFYWVPVVQATAPWFSLLIFSSLLSKGLGVISYLGGLIGAQTIAWILYKLLIRTGQHVPRWDKNGLTRKRFRSLFTFSINLSGISLINSIMVSIPSLIISRTKDLGGLSMVPKYNFTAKGPIMVSNLVQRTNFAFYPELQRLYIEGDILRFSTKYKNASNLCISFSLIAAGIVILITRTLVEILAGDKFYGGSAMALWLAFGVVSIPFAALFQTLREIAGNMGKTLIFSLLKLSLTLALIYPFYKGFGLAGIAALIMTVPLIDAAYGYYSGPASCGFKPRQLCGKILAYGLTSMLIVLALGSLSVYYPTSGLALEFRSRAIHLPGWSEILSGCSIAAIGGIFALYNLSKMKFLKIKHPN